MSAAAGLPYMTCVARGRLATPMQAMHGTGRVQCDQQKVRIESEGHVLSGNNGMSENNKPSGHLRGHHRYNPNPCRIACRFGCMPMFHGIRVCHKPGHE